MAIERSAQPVVDEAAELEKIASSFEQRRNHLQIAGRGLSPDEQRFVERTGRALPHLRKAILELRS